MNFEDYRAIFAVTALILMLIAATPILSLAWNPSLAGEHFSEFWMLGRNHMAQDYPRNVTVGEEYTIFLGVTNHQGNLAYYTVYLKVRNQTELPANSTTSPSSVVPLYESRFVIQDNQTWEEPVTFSILDALFEGSLSHVKRISVNGSVFSVNYASLWDSTDHGFYYQFLFELLMYDEATSGFRYQNRHLELWLNVTG